MNHSAKNQIRNLILVIFSAICGAFILSGVLLYQYGPSGRYMVRNALLSPDLLTTLSYNDTNIKTGGLSRFVYDGMVLSLPDSKSKQTREIQIDPAHYQLLYQQISSDTSLGTVPDSISTLFSKETPATLTIKVRTESHAEWQDESKAFQKLQFATEGNFYRIELHEEKSPDQWIYFNHPDIYQKALKVFIP
ncbi:MAG: hypothetical protein H0X51_05115 [Parachlamydiaceae bacterium]|nr:hypothetical protein [Parachlamydiaceae bacterium]